MGSKKRTKTEQTQTATTTPNVPDWLLSPYQTQATNIGKLQGVDPMSFAPTSTPALDKVWLDAEGLKDSDYSAATGLLDGVNYDLAGASTADHMGKYRDLFNRDVIDPVLSDYDEQSGKVRASQAADGARNGAFRGGRFGLREGETEGQLARGRAATYGGLLKDAANFAMSGASGDAARSQSAQEGNRAARFQGAGLSADITGRMGADTRANLATRGTFASQQADLQNKIREYPLEVQQKLNGLLAGLNPEMFTGQTVNSHGTGTTTQSGGLLGDLLKAAAQGAATAAVASDRRLKTDVSRVGRLDSGEGVYTYRYKAGGPVQMGVMAQEIQRTKPKAVETNDDGYLAVHYGKL